MFRSRDLVLVSGFAAVYIGYGYVSSLFFRQLTLSVDLFFLLAAMFALLAVVVRKSGAALLLGIVTGVTLLGSPAPAAHHIGASLVAGGLVFDIYLMLTRGIRSLSRLHITIAAGLGNLALSAVGLYTLQVSGLVLPPQLAPQLWALALARDSLAGIAGARFGLSVSRRIRPTATVSLKC